MAENIVQFDVNIDNRSLIDLENSGNRPQIRDILRLFAGERPTLAGTFVDRQLNASDFDEADAFEMNVDVDFTHDKFEGVTDNAYSGAITSIVGTFDEDISNVLTEGFVTLRADDGSREAVEYTDLAVTGFGPYEGTFTVDQTLTGSYDSGDFLGIQDTLMARATNSDVNQGKWTEESKPGGKLSFLLDCRSSSFLTKINTAIEGLSPGQIPDVSVYIQIKRYPLGGDIPVVLLQDKIYARPSVRDIESYIVPSGPDWSASDVRYLVKAGIGGGQTAYGGTLAGNDLNLRSTTHATKGDVNIASGTLVVDETLGHVGINGAAQIGSEVITADGAIASTSLTTQHRGMFVGADNAITESS